MKHIKQLTILLLFWLAGEGLVKLTGIAIPGSIIGILFLVAGLELKLIKPIQIDEIAHFLIQNMALFFVPAGVGLMCYFEIIRNEWFPIVASIVISTLVVMVDVVFIAACKKQNHE